MSEREAYLSALGLTSWVRRDAGPAVNLDVVEETPSPDREPQAIAAPGSETVAEAGPVKSAAPPVSEVASGSRARVNLGPGQGSCLYLCGDREDHASALASDLARVPVEAPVWGQVSADEGGQPLELAIAERLFSQVVVFGEAAARLVFGEEIPETCGPARVTVVDGLDRLARDAGARRSCWTAFKASGLVTRT